LVELAGIEPATS